MSTSRLLGVLLLVGGGICMLMAYGWSDTTGDQVNHFFTGDYRDPTIWLGVIGATASTIGLVTLGLGFRHTGSR